MNKDYEHLLFDEVLFLYINGDQKALLEAFDRLKFCDFDEKILWYGSVNYLGFSEKEACCMRICDAKIASEIESEVIK